MRERENALKKIVIQHSAPERQTRDGTEAGRGFRVGMPKACNAKYGTAAGLPCNRPSAWNGKERERKSVVRFR